MKRILLLGILALFVFDEVVAATTTPSTKPLAIYFWPASQRSRSKIKEEWIVFDRVKVPINRLYLANSEFEINYLGGYDFVQAEHGRWNATFVIPANPDVRWGVAVFRPGDFLPTLNEESLRGYIRGLERRGGVTEIQSTLDGLEFDASILGERPHEIRYVINGETKRSEFFLSYKGRIWVFAYEAPAKLYDANKENVFVIWARLRTK